MSGVTLCSFSKINLGLRVGPPRPDGYHRLTTLFQTVELHDRITISAERSAATEITLETSDPRVPTDARNTAYRIIEGALRRMRIAARVHVRLEKHLPPQGGMGAGSANAAAALLGLERELGQALPGVERLRLAEEVGSDVPVFLLGGTVYAHDCGQLVMPYPDLPVMHCVIVSPEQGVSTPAAFRAWDAHVEAMAPDAAEQRLEDLSRTLASACAGATPEQALRTLAGAGLGNDFEAVVFPQHPELQQIREALAVGALLAMLSGSGSSLFGLYSTPEEARAAGERVARVSPDLRWTLTRTLPRHAYWSTMFA